MVYKATGNIRAIDGLIASGFASGSHFARRYRAQFGITPSAERAA